MNSCSVAGKSTAQTICLSSSAHSSEDCTALALRKRDVLELISLLRDLPCFSSSCGLTTHHELISQYHTGSRLRKTKILGELATKESEEISFLQR